MGGVRTRGILFVKVYKYIYCLVVCDSIFAQHYKGGYRYGDDEVWRMVQQHEPSTCRKRRVSRKGLIAKKS